MCFPELTKKTDLTGTVLWVPGRWALPYSSLDRPLDEGPYVSRSVEPPTSPPLTHMSYLYSHTFLCEVGRGGGGDGEDWGSSPSTENGPSTTGTPTTALIPAPRTTERRACATCPTGKDPNPLFKSNVGGGRAGDGSRTTTRPVGSTEGLRGTGTPGDRESQMFPEGVCMRVL